MKLQLSGCASDAISEAEGRDSQQFRGSGDLSGTGPSGYGNRIRVQSRERGRRRERGQESRRAMDDKEDGGASLSSHQIVDAHLHLHLHLHLRLHLHSLYLAALFPPTHSITVALESRSEAKYVRGQRRSLGIQPLYLRLPIALGLATACLA